MGILVIFVGGLMIAWTLWRFNRDTQVRRMAEKVAGKVGQITVDDERRLVEIQFTYRDQPHKIVLWTSSFQLDQQVDVYVPPNEPSLAKVMSFDNQFGIPMFVGGFGLFVTVVGIALMIYS